MSAGLGRIVDDFDDHENILQAVRMLYQHYCPDTLTNTIESPTIRVALLGLSSMPRLPIVNYVGLVLAPYVCTDAHPILSTQRPGATDSSGEARKHSMSFEYFVEAYRSSEMG